ncbi:aminopeptidase P family N-terminal domain-containing protein [Sellimonas intestinalis]|uniref:aminopeptidase P family N-terminal domain-containing protein n=1 Tax=Sellimonas intestinalis TaxID=1653434 RepID=UPI00399F0074
MLKKIWDVIQERKIDGYLISKRENVRYISGFTGRGGWLLLTWDKQFLIIPKRRVRSGRGGDERGPDSLSW